MHTHVHVICIYTRIHLFPVCGKVQEAKSLSLIPFPTKRHQSSLEKWLTPRLDHGRYKMNLETIVMPES